MLLKNGFPYVEGQVNFNKEVTSYLQWIMLIFLEENLDTCQLHCDMRREHLLLLNVLSF